MKIDIKDVKMYIENIYAKKHQEIIFTKRIVQSLCDTFINNIKLDNILSNFVQSNEIDKFLENEKIILYIKERQPEISAVPDNVLQNMQTYFSKHLPQYTITEVEAVNFSVSLGLKRPFDLN